MLRQAPRHQSSLVQFQRSKAIIAQVEAKSHFACVASTLQQRKLLTSKELQVCNINILHTYTSNTLVYNHTAMPRLTQALLLFALCGDRAIAFTPTFRKFAFRY